MNLQEIENAVTQLSVGELETFSKWFGEFRAERWDREFEMDVKTGKLDRFGVDVDCDFDAGRCKPLS